MHNTKANKLNAAAPMARNRPAYWEIPLSARVNSLISSKDLELGET
jgi:hypothetical protein